MIGTFLTIAKHDSWISTKKQLRNMTARLCTIHMLVNIIVYDNSSYQLVQSPRKSLEEFRRSGKKEKIIGLENKSRKVSGKFLIFNRFRSTKKKEFKSSSVEWRNISFTHITTIIESIKTFIALSEINWIFSIFHQPLFRDIRGDQAGEVRSWKITTSSKAIN